jgi:hypothetical protein
MFMKIKNTPTTPSGKTKPMIEYIKKKKRIEEIYAPNVHIFLSRNKGKKEVGDYNQRHRYNSRYPPTSGSVPTSAHPARAKQASA